MLPETGNVIFIQEDLGPAYKEYLPKDIYESLGQFWRKTPEQNSVTQFHINIKRFGCFPGSETAFNLKQRVPFLNIANMSQLTGTKDAQIYIYKQDGLSLIMKNIKQAPFAPQTLEEYLKEWKRILPRNSKDPEYQEIYEVLKEFVHSPEIRLGAILRWCQVAICEIQKFLNAESQWFKPNPKYSEEMFLRIFTDKAKLDFLFVREIMGVMKELGLNVKWLEKQLKLDDLAIVCKDKLIPLIGKKNLNKVKLITVVIRRTNRRISYIPTFNGRHCVPIGDVFFEVLQDTIQGKNIFQRITLADFDEAFSIFKDLNKLFDCDMTKTCVIDTEKANCIRRRCDNHFNEFLKRLPAKKIKKQTPWDKTISTSDNTEKQLNQMGISENFPEIFQLYEEIYVSSDEFTSRSHYLAVVIQACQLGYIYKKMPNIPRFYHIQGTCQQSALNCNCDDGEAWNEEEFKDSEVSTTAEESVTSLDSKTAKQMKNKAKRQRQAEKKRLEKQNAVEEERKEEKQDVESKPLISRFLFDVKSSEPYECEYWK